MKNTNFTNLSMKTNFILFCFFLCFSIGTKAQYVTITDANFAAWLNANIPSAMSGGNLMDTTNTAVTNRTRISVKALGITNLSGIQYFDSLKTLDCGNGYSTSTLNQLTGLPVLPSTLDSLICGRNKLTSLPALPITLTYLFCDNNELTSIPTLPGGLYDFDCSWNKLTSLPALPGGLYKFNCSFNDLTSLPTLPSGLYDFDCSYNELVSFPTLPSGLYDFDCSWNNLITLPTLPSGLYDLDCSYNELVSLPTLPTGLNRLYCRGNNLTTIPTLPNGLSALKCDWNNLTNIPALPGTLGILWCENNQLTSLPALPSGLWDLSCNNNQLTSLPALPSALYWLLCDYNQLTGLPALPATLAHLRCNNNQLTGLPALPEALDDLFCQNNNISCFPLFPNILSDSYSTNFDISGNPFTCLPNYIPAMDTATLAFPLCLPGNQNGCAVAEGIVGFTYKDMNNNCEKNNGDSDLVNIPMKIYDSSGNNLLKQTYTAINGVYNFTNTPGTYTVRVDTAGMPFVAQCAFPGLDSTVTTTTANPLDTNVNFSLTCKPGFDIGIQSIVTTGLIFPGQPHSLSIVAGDITQWYNLNCATGVSGTVQISVTGPVTYVGPAAGALTPSVSANVFTYSITDFAAINNTKAFNLLFTTDTTAQSGDIICVNATVTPTTGDNDLSNNTFQYCYQVVNSFDPNMKEVYPVNVDPGYNGWFTYTIHFQNTGSAPAINILLIDTLNSNFDMKTFQVINYSHPNMVSIAQNILIVRYPSIMLPDSTTDNKGSMGFIQYRIKPKANLPLGTTIGNTCYIYFDFNTAVVTNTTVNKYVSTSEIRENIIETKAMIYPNPFTDQTTISFSKEIKRGTLKIKDVMGREVRNIQFSGKVIVLEKGTLVSGVYFVEIISNAEVITIKKIIVE